MVNSDQHYTLYVDGACRGNPGLGGWGALIIDPHHHQQERYDGDLQTTNNRMELTAAIEGIKACPSNATFTIYTDSTYVLKGITEWITGWKAKNWKGVKNPDLWQQLDALCQGRQIEWKWVKGHAGDEGNERADQLANLGADLVTKKKASNEPAPAPQEDWLLSDPFGLDMMDVEETTEVMTIEEDIYTETDCLAETALETPISTLQHPQPPLTATMNPDIHITQANNPQQGERLLILDTETTGFYYQDGDRIIEVGAIEMINRRLTGSSIHIYINPQKAVGESENIHGISDAFLKDKPVFKNIAETLYDYLKGAEIVAHNASFDMNFLDAEFERVGLGKLSAICQVTDTLAMAKRKHPGQKNSLDALVRRYEIPARDRTFHGALLDAEILADVYLAMTGGQVRLDIDHIPTPISSTQSQQSNSIQAISTPIILPHQHELDAHQQWMQHYLEKNAQPSLFEASTVTEKS